MSAFRQAVIAIRNQIVNGTITLLEGNIALAKLFLTSYSTALSFADQELFYYLERNVIPHKLTIQDINQALDDTEED